MIPIKFPEANVVYGKGQPEYEPLPAYKKQAWRSNIEIKFSKEYD